MRLAGLLFSLLLICAIAQRPTMALELAQSPAPATICAVQATGGPSPMLDSVRVVTGVVSADLIETVTGGFFMEHPGCDGDPDTSDGILVFTYRDTDVAVEVGQTVVVTGTVEEYYGMTQLKVDRSSALGVSVLGAGDPPTPTVLDPPADVMDALAYMEAHEGMFVSLPSARVVGATNAYGDAYVVPAESGIERIWRGEEDGRRIGLILPPFGWRVLDHGDLLVDVEGGLNFTYDNYKITVSNDFEQQSTGREPPAAAPAGEGELVIASYNVENLFDTLDTPGHDDGGSTPSEEDYPLELARRARSIADFLGAPDLVGVQEVESELALADLAAEEQLVEHGYDSILVEGPDVRGIDVGFLYKTSKLRLVEAHSAQKCQAQKPWSDGPNKRCTLPEGGEGWMLFSRPPLVARFAIVGRDAQLTIINNHFKSKGGGDAETTPERTAMARHALDLLAAEKAARPNVPVIVLGDLNEFPEREPIRTLLEPGTLVDLHTLGEERDFSYIFNGVSQILDYILVEPAMVESVIDFGAVHVNADFGAPPDGEANHPSPRASDHDPLLLRLPLPGEQRFTVHMPLALHGLLEDAGGAPPTQSAPDPTAVATDPAATQPPPAATATPSSAAPRTPLRITELFYDGEVPRVESDEFVEFENVTEEDVDLGGWRLISVRGNDQSFRFPAGSTIEAGQRCRVYTDEDHPELPCAFNWGYSSTAIWRNSGDKAELRDPGGALVDHRCYGDYEGQCP
jgi:hypothetical protein